MAGIWIRRSSTRRSRSARRVWRPSWRARRSACLPHPSSQRPGTEFAHAHEVPLLVDSAAGFGSVDRDGLPLGGQGDAEVFSFHATKPLAIGEGGMVSTADPEVADRVRRLCELRTAAMGSSTKSRVATPSSPNGLPPPDRSLSSAFPRALFAGVRPQPRSSQPSGHRASRSNGTVLAAVGSSSRCSHPAARSARPSVTAAQAGDVEVRAYYESPCTACRLFHASTPSATLPSRRISPLGRCPFQWLTTNPPPTGHASSTWSAARSDPLRRFSFAFAALATTSLSHWVRR